MSMNPLVKILKMLTYKSMPSKFIENKIITDNLLLAHCSNRGVAPTTVTRPIKNTKNCFIMRCLKVSGPDSN